MKDLKDNLQALQQIDVKYFGPTNSRGSRVKMTDLRFDESVTIPWDYAHNTALDVALAYLIKEKGVKSIYGYGLTKEHYFIVIKPADGKFTSLKTMAKRES